MKVQELSLQSFLDVYQSNCNIANTVPAVPIFFVGGPVWALAWSPISSLMYKKNPTQYIAISTHPTMESEYTVGKAYPGQNIIQILDVGTLDHG